MTAIMIYIALTICQDCFKHFSYMDLFNPDNNSIAEILFLSPLR